MPVTPPSTTFQNTVLKDMPVTCPAEAELYQINVVTYVARARARARAGQRAARRAAAGRGVAARRNRVHNRRCGAAPLVLKIFQYKLAPSLFVYLRDPEARKFEAQLKYHVPQVLPRVKVKKRRRRFESENYLGCDCARL